MKQLVVNGYSEGWLRRGFAWVYPKEVQRGAASMGTQVELRSPSGELLGSGIADDGWIAARVLRHDSGPIDDAWLWERLDTAAAHRDIVVDSATTGYRIVNAENDGLPGIRLDWWDHFAVIVLDSPSLVRLVPGIVSWLEDRRAPRGVYLCYRADPRDERDWAKVEPKPGLVAGHPASAPVRVTERGMAMLVDPSDGPDVGMYADMREVRAWMEPHWGGRSVLNTFSYTAAFSVAAALGGASDVVSVDLSSKVLERAEANFVANELDPAAARFIADDVFKALDRLRRTDEQFDIVILDPPAFSRSHEGIWSAKRDWPRLVAAAARVLAPGGWILAASNQGELSPRDFRGYVAQGLKRVEREGAEIFIGGQGADFPVAIAFPEGRYLKVGVWRVA